MSDIIIFTIGPTNRESFIEKVRKLDPEKLWKAEIIAKGAKRTRLQNSMYWGFITALGKHLGYTKDEMHDLARYKFLSIDVEVGGVWMRKLLSTPKADTKDFSEYYEACERWGTDLGFYWEPLGEIYN